MNCKTRWLLGILCVVLLSTQACVQYSEGLNSLGIFLKRQGRYAEAEPLYLKALAIREEALGPEHPKVAQSLNNLANLYRNQGRYEEAEQLHKRALSIREKALGTEHMDVAQSLNNLANLYKGQGRYAEAEPLYQRSLAIREEALGPEHPKVALSLNNLAILYRDQARYAEAEQLHKRALAIREEALGPEHPVVAQGLNSLAILYSDQGRYAEAERLHKRALAIREKRLGSEHREVAASLNGLANGYRAQGRYAEAEPLYRRSLAIREKALRPEHPDLALGLHNLALLYEIQGKYAEAEPLYQRSLAIWEKTLGPDHPSVALNLNNLAILYEDQGKYAEAERLHKRSLAIREKALGPEHPDVALSLNNLANLYGSQGKDAEAERLHKRSLTMREKVLGPGHRDVAQSLNNLANLYRVRGRYAEAGPLFRRALGIWEKVLGPEHPNVALSLNNLAFTLARRREFALARPLYERARRIQLTLRRLNSELDDEVLRALFVKGFFLRAYAELLAAIARDQKAELSHAPSELDSFVVVEQARSGVAQAALMKSGVRALSAEPATAQLARLVQDLRNRRRALDKRLTAEYSKASAKGSAERLKAFRKEMQRLDGHLAEATNRLLEAFPKYTELTSPEPIEVSAVRKMLRSGEALLSFFTLNDRLLAWLVRLGKKPVYRDIEISKAELTRIVSRVRVSIDQGGNKDLKVGLFRPFDVSGAHELYKLLLEPLRGHLAGVKHLIVVPDDVLLPLPFGALLTQAEGEPYRALANLYNQKLAPSPKELSDYAKLSWLAKDYAITVLPSATSLRALRRIARTRRTEGEPFIGFGDPVLQGDERKVGGAMLASRGTAVPLDIIRRLGRLPGTRKELIAVAGVLGANREKALYLGEKATEPVVVELNTSGRLAKAQVIAFATHGLIAGQVTGLRQPALLLTPPEKASEKDDGLLDLEDILGLKLDNADWVILSACNTAAADGSGEGLSGLVRAFFFAGARSLLVSHWSIDDRATQSLMTEVFRRYSKDKAVARSEALRQGMLELMAKAEGDTTYFAHPFAWAPFFLVGEGGVGTN